MFPQDEYQGTFGASPVINFTLKPLYNQSHFSGPLQAIPPAAQLN
jgi:hypothetical protein